MKEQKECKHEKGFTIGTIHDYCRTCDKRVISQGHIDIQTDPKHKKELQKRRDNIIK